MAEVNSAPAHDFGELKLINLDIFERSVLTNALKLRGECKIASLFLYKIAIGRSMTPQLECYYERLMEKSSSSSELFNQIPKVAPRTGLPRLRLSLRSKRQFDRSRFDPKMQPERTTSSNNKGKHGKGRVIGPIPPPLSPHLVYFVYLLTCSISPLLWLPCFPSSRVLLRACIPVGLPVPLFDFPTSIRHRT